MMTSRLFDSNIVKHAFFTRKNGVSKGLYAGLNCGAGSSDDPEHVIENKRRAAQRLHVPADRLLTLHQIHSSRVVTVDEKTDLTLRPEADAMVTKIPGIALGILTADCVPLLFADTHNKIIGAAHSGWKGSIANIGAKVVEAMIDLGAERKKIGAIIGPAIQQKSYEVGPDFPTPFLDLNPEFQQFFIPSITLGHHMFDLPGFVEHCLKAENIGNIERVHSDTCSEEDIFFSYRRMCHRSETDYGRHLSAITLQG